MLLLGLGEVPARLLAEVAEALRTGLAVTARAGPRSALDGRGAPA